MKRVGWISGLVALALAMLVAGSPAVAQVDTAKAVSACGTPGNTPVTGNVYPMTADLTGALCTAPAANGSAPTNSANYVSGVTAAMTGTTSTLLLAVPGAGVRNYLTQLTCGNSHATVGTFVNVQDGSGGTTLYTIPAAAVYGGAVLSFPTPLRQPTANTGLYVVDATTGANVICSGAGYKGA